MRITIMLNDNQVKELEQEAEKARVNLYTLIKTKALAGLNPEPVKRGRPVENKNDN